MVPPADGSGTASTISLRKSRTSTVSIACFLGEVLDWVGVGWGKWERMRGDGEREDEDVQVICLELL